MKNQIIEIIADELNVDAQTITNETNLKDDLNVDSLDVVELIMRLEDAFDIEVSDDDAAKLNTVGDIINFVNVLK